MYENRVGLVKLGQEKQNVRKRETGQIKILKYLSRYYYRSNHTCWLVSSSQLHVWCETPLRSSSQNGAATLSCFTLSYLLFNCLYVVQFGSQLTSVFYPALTLNGFPVCVSFSQSELVVDSLLIRFCFKLGRLLL